MTWTTVGWSIASFLVGMLAGGAATVRLLVLINRLEKKRRQDRNQ